MSLAIETQGLTRSFDGRVAVEGLDLAIERGETFALLGPNGAGKTTTVRMLCALLAPTSGEARVMGHDVRTEPERVRARIGLLTEAPGLYDRLSAWEILLFFAGLHGIEKPEAEAERYLRLLGLWEARERPTGGFSKGMKQKVALARALFHQPEVLFLDEPTSGLDVETARQVRCLLAELRGKGRTIVLTTHDLDEAERLADRIAVVRGRLIATGRPQELRARLFSPRVAVTLENASEALRAAAAAVPGVQRSMLDGSLLRLDVEDPGAIPDIVAALVAAGGRILAVGEERPPLEEIYLRVLESSGART